MGLLKPSPEQEKQADIIRQRKEAGLPRLSKNDWYWIGEYPELALDPTPAATGGAPGYARERTERLKAHNEETVKAAAAKVAAAPPKDPPKDPPEPTSQDFAGVASAERWRASDGVSDPRHEGDAVGGSGIMTVCLFRADLVKTKYGDRVRLAGLRWHSPQDGATYNRQRSEGIPRDRVGKLRWREFGAWVNPKACSPGLDRVIPCFADVHLQALDLDRPPRIASVRAIQHWPLQESMSALSPASRAIADAHAES